MRKTSLWLIMCLMLAVAACKPGKKTSLSDAEEVEAADFIDFFPDQKAPFEVGDTLLIARTNDSLRINNKVFRRFIPDSVLKGHFTSSDQLSAYPIAKLGDKDKYLFARVTAGKKRAAYILAFNNTDSFVAALPLFKTIQPGTQQLISIDSRYTITRTTSKKDQDDAVTEGRDVFVLNNEAHAFTLIMTDALDNKPGELINPIDTFARKEKYSADYGTGKNILFSFRDGRKNDRTTFFINFEKDEGACSAELKGEAIWQSANIAVYREPGDPCSLEFKFTGTSVVVKEIDPCGNYRSLRCLFDGTYAKKKVVKPKNQGDTKKKTRK